MPQGSSFTVGLAYWPGGTLEAWGAPSGGLDPCNATVQANLVNYLWPLGIVVMAPHIGSSTMEVRVERGRKVLANLAAHFAGKAVPYPIP